VIEHIENPRKEKEEHYYNPVCNGLRGLGVEPHYLTAEVLARIFSIVAQHKGRIRKDTFYRGVRW
jgi:UDP-sulfoquinovose synthase